MPMISSAATSGTFSPLTLTASRVLRRVRPAGLGSWMGTLCGLTERRPFPTRYGQFSISPMSMFGGLLLQTGEYEPQMIAVLRKYLNPGGVFVDLGANEGYFSVIASGLVGSGGRVIAIEPQSRLQAVIHTNLRLNSCTNVELEQIVLSGVNGELDLTLTPQTNTGGSSLWPSRQKLRGVLSKERVRSRTLGSFLAFAGIAGCDLMKVDIEGAEWEVFMNAGDVLHSGAIRRFVLEIHNPLLEARGLRGIDLHEFILSCGYSLDDSLGPWVYYKTPDAPAGKGVV
jgi:FkbM family methyltransferase